MYKCFVVCPFGNLDKGEEEARLFRELVGLKKNVFKRAEQICRKNGFDVEIADARRELKPGERLPTGGLDPSIMGGTQRGIDEADAVIVILNANKPNVFIELGWAHGMWQAPILLISDAYMLPADINNLLGVPYGAAVAAGDDKKAAAATAERLAGQIMQRLRTGRRQKPFDHWPETTLARGQVHVYNRFSKAFSKEDWSAVLQQAENEIIIASTGMSKIGMQEFFRTAPDGSKVSLGLSNFLLLKATEGVSVTILMYHESNMTLGQMKRLEQGRLALARAEIESAFESWSLLRLQYENARLAARDGEADPDFKPGGGVRVIQLSERHLPFRVTLTEKRAIFTMRFYTEAFNSGLCLDALAPGEEEDPYSKSVYTQIRDELQFLIDDNSEPSERRYQEWRAQRA